MLKIIFNTHIFLKKEHSIFNIYYEREITYLYQRKINYYSFYKKKVNIKKWFNIII